MITHHHRCCSRMSQAQLPRPCCCCPCPALPVTDHVCGEACSCCCCCCCWGGYDFFSPFTSSLAKLQISSRGMRTWHYPRRVESYPVSARLRSPAQLLTNTWWNIDCNVLPCNLLQRLQSGGTMSWGYVCWTWFSSDCIYLLHLQVMRFHRNRCIYSWPELC